MEVSILSGEDIRFLATQPESEVTSIVGQMTTLMESITSLQQDTDERVEAIAKQGWFKRMWATVSGKNKATKQEIQRNQDKVVGYISQSVAQLYQMNCINQQAMCSLGNRMNEVYMQVTNMYNDQLNIKGQISEIMAVQQKTLEAMGAFVSKLNEKIESVDNFHMLISEIQNGMYSDNSKLYNLCMILSQLDKRSLDDERKMNLLKNTLEQSGVVTYEEKTVLQCLNEIIALPQEKIGLIYMELCTFRDSFPANLFADMIESYHFLPKMEKMSKKKEVLIQRVMDKYELDSDAAFSISDISESFIENKQASLISLQDIKKIESHVSKNTLTDEEIDKIADDFWTAGKYSELIDFINPLVEQGNALAQFKLGMCYESGDGVQQSYHKAVEWYTKAAEQGNSNAQYFLGYCYYYGDGVPQNYSKAIELFTKAAEQGNLDAQYKLGDCYYNGEGAPQNSSTAVEWFTKAAEWGHEEAQFRLGFCYHDGDGVPQNYSKAIELFTKSAEQGNSDAQFMLGRYYYNGEGVPQNYRKAVEWYTEAAEQGHKIAQFMLGKCYYNGEGVPQNYRTAVEWCAKSAEQGFPPAQFELGECYYYGEGVPLNYRKAVEWYTEAAEQGNSDAQFRLGKFYYYGDVFDEDYYEAVEFFTKAAEQGHEEAQCMLGDCYYNGNGVEEDDYEAVKWYTESAEQGLSDAQYKLGECYYYGIGVAEDEDEAIEWYIRAAEQGNEDAIEKLEELGINL